MENSSCNGGRHPTATGHGSCKTFLAMTLFERFFLGGFECSCHRLENGRRLDMLAGTRHDVFAAADYARLRDAGITACREGISWVKSERMPGAFDFSSFSSRLAAARTHGIQVIWDLLHFGWPDDIDVFSVRFPERFARYARAVARWYASESGEPAFFAPVNEMSFLAWAGGDVRVMNPFEAARGVELKAQLVRASLEAMSAIRAELPDVRFLQPEPVINIVPSAQHPKTWRRVEADNLLQYQAWDMLAGRVWPSLNGRPDHLDVLGVNFYSDNQFMLDGSTVHRGDPRYKPFSRLLLDVWERYRRPMIVSETGAEGDGRAEWLRYVCEESLAAMEQGVELQGITLYPVIDYRGWADGRDCKNGLWGDADDDGRRSVHVPLLDELQRWEPKLRAARDALLLGPALASGM
jgi:hypothetical protein